jgi:hypothetical protein
MAINVNTVYQTVLLILNKEQRGYMTPVEYNRIATQSQLDIFEQYFEDLNQQLRVPQADLDYSDRQLNIDEKISPFKTFGNCVYDAPSSSWSLPTTDTYSNTVLYNGQEPTTSQVSFYKLGSVTYNPITGFPVELQRLARNEFYNIQKSPLTASTKDFPTYLYENKKLYVRPTSINQAGDITVDFLRKPKNIVWSYWISDLTGAYLYNDGGTQPPNTTGPFPSTGSQNFELQESEQTRLILKILLYAGIVIRDPQIVQAAASEVQQNEINQKS